MSLTNTIPAIHLSVCSSSRPAVSLPDPEPWHTYAAALVIRPPSIPKHHFLLNERIHCSPKRRTSESCLWQANKSKKHNPHAVSAEQAALNQQLPFSLAHAASIGFSAAVATKQVGANKVKASTAAPNDLQSALCSFGPFVLFPMQTIFKIGTVFINIRRT